MTCAVRPRGVGSARSVGYMGMRAWRAALAVAHMGVGAVPFQRSDQRLASRHGRALPARRAGRHARGRAPVRSSAFGDSLMAGFGLPARDAFPRSCRRALQARRASMSSRQCRRIRRHHQRRPGAARLVGAGRHRAVILELGANDMLRGVAPDITEKPRRDAAPAAAAQDPGAAGRHARRAQSRPGLPGASTRSIPDSPPTTARCSTRSSSTASRAMPALNQPDGLHPTAAGIDVIVDRILPKVEELVASSATRAMRPQPRNSPCRTLPTVGRQWTFRRQTVPGAPALRGLPA